MTPENRSSAPGEPGADARQGSGRALGLGTIALLAAAAWVLYQARTALIVLIGAILLAAFLSPAVERLSRARLRSRPLGKKFAAAIVMLIAAVVLGAAIVLIVPRVWEQAKELAQALPDYVTLARMRILELENLSNLVSPEVERAVETELARLMAQGGSVAASWVVSQAVNLLQLVVLMVIPIGAYYVLTDGGNLRKQLLLGMPPAWRPRVRMVMEASTSSLSRYVQGQTAVCIITAVLHSIGFAITGLPYWLIIGILAGLAEAVPFLGALVVIVTVAIVGLAQDPQTAVFALLYYVVIGNQVANYFITPRLMSERLDVHPFAIILAALVGSSLGGPVGALIALPTAVVLQSLTRQLWGGLEEAEPGS